MKTKILLSVVISFMFMGVVSAASLWGTYKGNTIIRVLVDGKQIKEPAVPAVSFGGKIMIPIDVLKDSGINYTYDQKNLTVNLISPKKNEQPVVPEKPKEMTLKDIYKQAIAVGYVESYDAYGKVACSGSGVFVNPGYLITNYHVGYCGNTGKITVKINGDIYTNGPEAWYYFKNQSADLYGVPIGKSFDSKGNPIGLPGTFFNIIKTELPEIGDKVYAIGSPYGLENTISEGVVSGIRTIDGKTLIQHTADTEHGSSGGALLDKEGYLIGITSSGFDGTNLDFAIPISYVKKEFDNRLLK